MIDILMATYNAQEFLLPQLQSIFSQTGPSFHLTIRDNASTDKTVAMIRAFASEHPGRVTLIEGTENLGAKGNFAYLAGMAQGDYVMFADADDVWMPQKIALTFAEMESLENKWGKETPLLVHSDLQVVDRTLRMIHPSFWDYTQRAVYQTNRLNKLLIQNSVTGNTVMVNRALLMRGCPIPPEAAMHDWWLTLVACAFGHIGVVEDATVLYRQHGNNVLGAREIGGVRGMLCELQDGLKIVAGRLFQSSEKKGDLITKKFATRYLQAQAFLERYATSLTEEQRQLVEAFVSLQHSSWVVRKKLLLQHKLYPSTWVQRIGMFLLD